MTVGIAPDAFSGFELLDAKWAQALAGGQNDSVQTVAAHAGSVQATATQIGPNAALVYVSTVTTTHDSIKLPQAIAGQRVMILNGAASNTADIFGYNSTDTINGTVGSTAYTSLAGNKAVVFFCPVNGKWGAVLTA